MKRNSLLTLMCIIALVVGPLQAGDKWSGKGKFSLVVRGGFGTIGIGDFNSTIRSINNDPVYENYRQNMPQACVGAINAVPDDIKDLEVELQWAVGRRLSIGLAASSPTNSKDKSFLNFTTYDSPAPKTYIDIYGSEVRTSVPIRFSVNYSIPVLSKVNVVIIGGAGYYHARMSQTLLTLTRGALDYQNGMRKTVLNASGFTAGIHGGAALEYRIGPLFSVSAEAQWKYAKITRLNGEWSGEASSYGANGGLASSWEYVPVRGHLYLYHIRDDRTGSEREKLTVSSTDEIGGADYIPHDIRRAALDLSGFSFRIGFKVRLF